MYILFQLLFVLFAVIFLPYQIIGKPYQSQDRTEIIQRFPEEERLPSPAENETAESRLSKRQASVTSCEGGRNRTSASPTACVEAWFYCPASGNIEAKCKLLAGFGCSFESVATDDTGYVRCKPIKKTDKNGVTFIADCQCP